MAEVRFADGQLRWFPYSALEPVPSQKDALSVRFAAGQFVEPDWLRRTLTRLRVTGRLSEIVYSMEATKTDFYAYQFKPVIKLMNSPTDALLIADEVGLGKTIEAGLIWTELRARLDCDRLLVVCPKTLCQKWQDELARRFGVEAQIANARTVLASLRRSRETGRGFAMVSSMQGLRPPRGWDDAEPGQDNPRDSVRTDLARFFSDQSDDEPLIDLLVVDEAHHMRNPDTMLHRFGLLASSVASHRLFLSATPIHLRNRDLHSLLSMVDPDTFELESTVDALIATNAPIVAARDLLLRTDSSPADILKLIDEARGHEILRHSRALAHIRDALPQTSLTRSHRSELAARLEGVNQLANYVTRTRRRDVEEFRVVREPKAPFLPMHACERRFYDEVSEVVREYAILRDASAPFLLSTPQRLLTSSMAAASAYWSKQSGSRASEEIEETDEDLQASWSDERPLVGLIADRVRDLDLTAHLTESDTKYKLLIKELVRHWEAEPDAKIIVFSSFIPTLHYLEGRLSQDGVVTTLLHGNVKRPREQILATFRQSDDVRVLLSSEIGSEGVDLQFSSTVVNYDLPWNPMRLEQRIGRIDRLGQTRDKVTILNLVYEDTIDRRIYERLYQRLQIGERALGEMEAVLGEPIRELTAKLLDPKLSDKQKEEAIEQTAEALEYRRQVESQLESEASSLVQHGDYVLEQIMESRNRHRWLSADDILTYVHDRLLRDFPESVIESCPAGSDTYRIDLSPECAAAFKAYLVRRGLQGRTNLVHGGGGQRYRFTSSVAQQDDETELISQLHPLVRFATERDLRDKTTNHVHPVAAIVSQKALPAGCLPGTYVLFARRWSSGSSAAGTTASVRINYAGADVLTGQPITSAMAESMLGAVANKGRPMANARMHDALADAADVLRNVVEPEIGRQVGEYAKRVESEIDDRLTIRLQSLSRHFEKKLSSLRELQKALEVRRQVAKRHGETRRATNLKNLAAAQEARITKLQRTWAMRKSELEAQKKVLPEEVDVCCVFLQVDL